MSNLLEANGGQPQKQPKYIPIFMDRAFTGLYTQRAVLHDPSDVYTARFYGGRPDALWMGKNIELTNRLTLQRRPGLSPFSAALYPTPPNRAFSFELSNGTIQVVIDTGSTGALTLTAASNASVGNTTYTGTISGGQNNAFVGMQFVVTGFVNTNNNGTFVAVASTSSSITLANPQGTSETHAATASSSGAVYIDNQDGSKTLLYAKSPTAGQMYFIGVAGILYMGDGVDTVKYTPGNPNGVIWKWGILAPGKQPNVVITPSGAAAVQWVPSTVWSTMGFVYDTPTNSVQQLNGIFSNTDNSTGLASTTLGLTGNGQPVWNNSPGGTTTDNTITWTNRGPIVLWTANTQYSNASTGGTAINPCIVYDPKTKSCFIQSNSNPGLRTSGPNYPNFVASPGAHTNDGQVVWIFIGPGNIPGQWKPSTVYPALGTVSDNDVVSSISEPVSLQNGLPTDGTVVYWQTSGGGTSGATATSPFGATAGNAGQPTTDNDLTWMSLGSGQWTPNRPCIAWMTQGTVFTAIKDPNGNAQVCITGGSTGGTQPGTGGNPPWGTTYGATTHDGTVVWTCVGTMMSWAAATQWYFPVVGFAPPTNASPFGGAAIIDSNNNVEFVINSGKGKAAPHPVWNTNAGGTFATSSTTDGAATWYNLEPFSTQSLSWKFGHVYTYSFKARSLTDFYSVPDPTTGLLPIPPGLSNPLPPPTGSETGAISTASPVFTITGSNNGAVNTISGVGSLDPQVDTIVIWRDADGGGPDNMFELTEIPAPKPVGNTPGTWTFRDFLPDVANNTFPGLNVLLPAPINDQNDPPPSGFLPMVFNYQRIWGANGQQVNFSGGPDIVAGTGNPNEAFAPADELPFLAQVIRLVKTPQGIVTFLTDSIEMIGGGPATATFFSVTMAPGVGLLSFNALDVFAGEIYFFGADNMFRVMTPSLNLSNFGFPLGDQFANLPSSGISDTTWNPANVYVAVHQNGIDNCIFVADGSTGWYRLNPHQTPGAAQGPEPVWSVFAQITNGAKMVQSVETGLGVKKLLVGSTATNQNIRYRNLGIYTDSVNFGSIFPDAPGFDTAAQAANSTPVTSFSFNADVVAPNEWAFLMSTEQGPMVPDGSGWNHIIANQYFKLLGTDTGTTTFSGQFTGGATSYVVGLMLFFTNGTAPALIQSGSGTADPFTLTAQAAFSGSTVAGRTYIAVLSGSGPLQSPVVTDTEGNNWNVAVTNSDGNGRYLILAFANNVIGGTADSVTISGLSAINGGQMFIYEFSNISTTTPTLASTYDANFVMGSITLAHPGQLSLLKFLEFDFNGIRFQPEVSYLLNETSGTFTPFVDGQNGVPQADPPSIYGQTSFSTSYSPNRYYFSSNAALARCRHMQIKVDYGSTANGDELYNMTIFGRFITET